MFKELKVVKLIVFISLLLVIIVKMSFSDNIIVDLYTDKISYSAGESVKIYVSTNSFFSLNRKISINDVTGKEISTIEIKLNHQEINSKPFEDGLGFKDYIEYKLPESMTSGIYLIENKYPIIVKSKRKTEITVVYPFGNNVLYQTHKGSNVFGLKTRDVSLHRTAFIDKYSKGLKPFFEYLNSNYKVNYIADLDLEDINNYKTSKLLLIYGKSTCWTPKMEEGFKRYVSNSGNVLLMSSYLQNNICWFEKETNSITMYNKKFNAVQSWINYNGRFQEKTVGISYVNSGYSKDSGYIYTDKNHPILKEIEEGNLSLEAELYSAPPVIWRKNLPRIDLDSLRFYQGKIIAFGEASYKNNGRGIKGIFVLQPDSTSGKIVSFGTEDWCLKENYQENKNVSTITKNAITYLLKE